MLVLFTDTDNDVTPSIAKEYGYKGLISMPYSIGEKIIYPYKDADFTEETYNAKEYYDMLRSGNIPQTSCVTVNEYIEYFEPEFKEGNDILYVHFSRKLSSSFDFMDKALVQLKEKYPDRKFYEIDTKAITFASLPIIFEVGNMYKAGKSIDEILKWAEVEVDKYATYMFVDDLNFFKLSGRVKGISAFMGSLIGIKPIIYMDPEGYMVSHSKERGKIKAINKIFEYLDELGDDVENHYIVIGNTDMPDSVELFKQMIHDKYPDKELKLVVSMTNPTSGSKSGPDGVGITFHAIHR